jgi:hypothetical protein
MADPLDLLRDGVAALACRHAADGDDPAATRLIVMAFLARHMGRLGLDEAARETVAAVARRAIDVALTGDGGADPHAVPGLRMREPMPPDRPANGRRGANAAADDDSSGGRDPLILDEFGPGREG